MGCRGARPRGGSRRIDSRGAPLRTLILDPYYAEVIDEHYRTHPGLEDEPYAVQWRALMDVAFGTSDAYSFHLSRLGHDAHEIVSNCRPLQLAWARENRPRLARLPWKLAAGAIVLEQAAWYQPDVVYVQSVGAFRPLVLRALRRGGLLLAGQLASRPPDRRRLRAYDVLFTSLPHFLGRLGVPTHVLRIGFDDRVVDRLAGSGFEHGAVFVGQLGGGDHRDANAVIEAAARSVPIDFWGPGAHEWPPGSPIRERHRGIAWGMDMYRVLSRARLALNRHIDIAEGHANNMRLFEATGVGTLLLTDEADGLEDLFAPGREVVTYAGVDELVEKVRWYLAHDEERTPIAAAGQRRTLAEHTYGERMQELVALLEPYVRRAAGVRRMMSSRSSKR